MGHGSSPAEDRRSTTEPRNRVQYSWLVGCVAQWLERWSMTGELPCPMLDLQLTGVTT